jgi:CBS domain containing-hemolysin-like protein
MDIMAMLAVVVLLAVNAWFVAFEYSIVAARRSDLEGLADGGADGAGAPAAARARRALAALDDRPRRLAGTQLGITVASLGLGVLIEPAVAELVEPAVEAIGDPSSAVVRGVSFAVALAIVAFLHMVLGEMVPKALALASPERSLMALTPGNSVYMAVFRPFIRVLDLVSSAIIRMLRLRSVRELGAVRGPIEFAALLDASREVGLLEEFEHNLLAGALDFRSRAASSVMVPRERVVYVNRRMTVGSIERIAHRSGHSRLPVVGTGLDNVIGFLHVKDLLRLPLEARDEPVPLELIRRMLVVPEDRPLEDVLRAMRRARSHVALVRGADGRTLGIVTLEDLLEELVGEIRDESDRESDRAAGAAVSRGTPAGRNPTAAGPQDP